MRDGVGMIDVTAFAIFDVTGPGVVEYIERMTVNKCDVAVGRAVYTPLLSPEGGFKADLTVMRLGEEHFRIISGGFDGPRDSHWFRRHLPSDGSVHFEDQTSAICTVGVWGPQARELLARVTNDDLSDDALAYGHTKEVHIGSIPARLFRISYVGELGYEVYTSMQHGLALWNRLWDAGQDFGVVPVGAGVYGTTGRLEKGYRLMGAELEAEYNPVEAGLDRPKVKDAEFIGKTAYLRARDGDAAAVLCTLTMEDHTSAAGIPRYPTGANEPILTPDGERIVDRKGRVSRVTSAGAGPSVGKFLLLAYLPPEHAVVGNDLLVLYMNETYPVKVAVAGSTPLFDPDNDRMKSGDGG
jgi:glycine cleavage system aminomethyltransferase T